MTLTECRLDAVHGGRNSSLAGYDDEVGGQDAGEDLVIRYAPD